MNGPKFSESNIPDDAPRLDTGEPDWAKIAEPSTAEFGPDATAAVDEDSGPFANLKTRKAAPRVNGRAPRSAGSTFGKLGGKLGTNKKLRSPVRKLTPTDRDKIATLYTFGAAGLMPFRQKAAMAMAEGAETCADAWMELADQNDNVRRVLLAFLEGGVWGKVFAAHLPILVALIPESALPPMFRGNLDNFTTPDSPETGE